MSKIKLKHSGGNGVSLNPPTSAPGSSEVAFKLPSTDGTANQLLKTDASGNLGWRDLPTFAVGGEVKEYVESGTTYRAHTFLGTSKFITTGALTVDYLLVAGGGGSTAAEGNSGSGGGAGGGGMVVATSQAIAEGTHTVTVGAGGAKSTNYSVTASAGGNSTFNSHVATGGAPGPKYGVVGPDGGCGAGGSESSKAGGSTNQNTYSGVTNVTGYGNDGGDAAGYPSGGSGAGGGAGGAGGNANGGTVAGGIGRASTFRDGSSVTYARGGNGVEGNTNSSDEAANTGNGAHGVSVDGATSNTNSGDGGSGIVVIRYAVS